MLAGPGRLPANIYPVPPYQRDPLSVRYDPHARMLITRAINGRSHGRPVWVRGALEIRHGYHEDAGGRLPDERALLRALYHDPRIHKPRKNSGGPWSLQVDWTGRIGAVSMLRLRVLKDTSGARHAATHRDSSWVRNEDLRSGGLGSGRERFPA